MGKRSPILGYNHNVRYRGLVFHVQTEDSGIASPHLFTHLFHHGVIVSTRKLVYDAGSAEESIKSLMQAQHKAVLKDLRRGHFDDKIDSYLGGTPGLLPRGAEDAGGQQTEPNEATGVRPASEPSEAEAELAASNGAVDQTAGAGLVDEVAIGVPTEQIAFEDVSQPVMIVEKTPPPGRLPPPIPTPPPIPKRTPTSFDAQSPKLDTTLRTEAPVFDLPADGERAEDSAEIEIRLDVEEDDETGDPGQPRRARDTENQLPVGHQTRPTLTMTDGKPTHGMVNEEARRAAMSDGVPGAVRSGAPAIPPPLPDPRKLGDRPSTINAATLPAPRPISRPPARPALSPPQVVLRPLAGESRNRPESEAVEVYSPALPSAELPPSERPGQYAQHKKISTRIPLDGLKDAPPPPTTAGLGPRTDPRIEPRPEAARIEPRAENVKPAGVPVPAGLGRPPVRGGPGTTPPPRGAGAAVMNAAGTPSATIGPSGGPSNGPPPGVGREPLPRTGGVTEPLRARVPTPSRNAAPGTQPVVSRTGTAGVVMTRPAVIVGGPTGKAPATVPRIRKAREDEGRGFGQGLISEKSLDEVILAYLSEDADEK